MGIILLRPALFPTLQGLPYSRLESYCAVCLESGGIEGTWNEAGCEMDDIHPRDRSTPKALDRTMDKGRELKFGGVVSSSDHARLRSCTHTIGSGAHQSARHSAALLVLSFELQWSARS